MIFNGQKVIIARNDPTQIFSDATHKRWGIRARRGAYNKLLNLLEFRERIPELREREELMEAYEEAARSMCCAADTIRKDIGIIREYAKRELIYWIRNGVSFDHIENANDLAELAHKTACQLLNECIDPGNATGETMTVREMMALALGERNPNPPVFRFNVLYSQLLKFPTQLKWGDEKTRQYEAWLDEGRKFFDDNCH